MLSSRKVTERCVAQDLFAYGEGWLVSWLVYWYLYRYCNYISGINVIVQPLQNKINLN